MTWHGYVGRVLHVDLTGRTWHVESLDETLARDFIGGRGLGGRMLWDLAPAHTDALAPEAPLVFATGPLTGTKAPTAGRFSLSGRSPLTGTIFETNCGGSFGVRLKGAGYDALVVTGASDGLIVLDITADDVSFLPAEDLLGADVPTVTDTLFEGRKDFSVAAIGPAGERLVKLATIMVDGRRALGRGGMGAVMGSKRLKAIRVAGEARPTVARPDDLEFFLYEVRKTLKANPVTSRALPEFGTAMLMKVLGKRGVTPAYNFRSAVRDAAVHMSETAAEHHDLADALSGERLADEYLIRRSACWGCPIGCGRVSRTASGGEAHGPEYETLWALGANLGISDLGAVIGLNELCNRLGIDTISAGGTIAAAMELAEGGAALGVHAGNVEEVRSAIERMAYREGDDGDAMAEGSRALCERYGAPEMAMQVKGLELPAYDPRAMQGQGLGYATANRGGCHLAGNMLGFEVLGTPKLVDADVSAGKAGLLIVAQHLGTVLDSLSLCKFSAFALSEEHYARLYAAVTGIEIGGQDLLRAGERIWNMERLYNLREGFTAADDRLPTRLLEEPNAAGEVVRLDEMLAEYYRFRGWTPEGIPTQSKLEQLGLTQLAAGGRLWGEVGVAVVEGASAGPKGRSQRPEPPTHRPGQES